MGSYYAKPVSANTWRIMETYYVEGQRKSRQVPKEAYHALGIDPTWPFEKAHSRAKQLNAENRINKSQVTAAASRVRLETLIESTFLPQEMVAEFLEEMRQRSVSTNDTKMLFHWQFVQKLIVAIGKEPKQYAANAPAIYKYIQDQKVSLSYTEKVLRMLNLWGRFVARKQQAYFEEVEQPARGFAKKIAEAQRKAKPTRGPSLEMTPKLLAEIKDKLPNERQVNWLDVSIWFGLRPEEVNQFINVPENHYVENDGEVDILMVYQTKLEHAEIDEQMKWKGIPVLFDEQQRLLPIIESGELEQPLNRTLKALTRKRITGYGGRKGFVDLMLSLGQELDHISSWMGHLSIERTWKSYKNKQRVHYKNPRRSA